MSAVASPGCTFTRRRVMVATAAAGTVALWSRRAPPESPRHLRRWRGTALGGEAEILLNHPDAQAARRIMAVVMAEVDRLEAIFSLYREDSALSRLNRCGRLDDAPFDLVRQLAEAQRFGALTAGAFDVTVQPLWRLYADHFFLPPTAGAAPPGAALERARRLVDYRSLDLGRRRIAFAKPGMAVTLNGIAQGYITDRVTELLRDCGLHSVLVQLGEIRALGGHPSGRGWRVAIGKSESPGRTIDLADKAVATSAGRGRPFVDSGRYHHLFDPRTGDSARYHGSVTVVADTATRADALSTAFSAMSPADVRSLVASLRDAEVYLSPPSAAKG